jgi:hypothetical protein
VFDQIRFRFEFDRNRIFEKGFKKNLVLNFKSSGFKLWFESKNHFVLKVPNFCFWKRFKFEKSFDSNP